MKTPRRPGTWIAAIVAIAATTAFAQREQWLDYHTSATPKGYLWVDLTAEPPADVALPELGKKPYFARWETPMDGNGPRWICLDRTRRSGPYDRMFVDSNGNGRLDDESPVTVLRRSSSSSYFKRAKLVFQTEDGPVSYHLVCRYYKYDDDDEAQLLVGSGGYYKGKVKLAGKTRTVQLQDRNVNGVFNDSSSDPSKSDRIQITGGKSLTRYLGRYLEIDDQLLEIKVARDGAFIKVQPAKDVVLGQLQVPETISELAVIGENGHFVRTLEGGECSLPVGHYRFHNWKIERRDDQGVEWRLQASGFEEKAEFDVAVDAPATMKVGEPVTAELEAKESKRTTRFSLELVGNFGETLSIWRGSKRPRAPRMHLASADGQYEATRTFEYG